ncbi:MAG: tetratricopeptide repeat protein [Pseudomonadota bacterium]
MIYRLVWLTCISILMASNAFAHQEHNHTGVDIEPSAWAVYLQRFRQTGEARDLHAAKQIAASIATTPLTAEQLYLAAQTAQADHRFDDALDHLDRLLTYQPHFDAARLMRANTLMTVGRAEQANHECNRLRELPLSVVLACRVMNGADERTARSLVSVLHAETSRLSDQWRAWVFAILGDNALQRESPAAAVEFYATAITLDPLISYRVTYAEALLQNDSCAQALQYTSQFTQHLALQVKQAIAARRCGTPDHLLEAQLNKNFSQQIEQQDFSHGREMAEYQLFVANNIHLARRVLDASLRIQRTPYDLRLRQIAHAAPDKLP